MNGRGSFDDVARNLAYLRTKRGVHLAANLGSALAQSKRYTEGLPELERALGLQPSSTLVLNNLAVFYARQEEYARALDFWNRSLAIDPRQPKVRVAVEAARTRL